MKLCRCWLSCLKMAGCFGGDFAVNVVCFEAFKCFLLYSNSLRFFKRIQLFSHQNVRKRKYFGENKLFWF